ncbi:MAG: ATP-binding cassette domain-containing protein [Clostridiales bacterium]|nr:ATP-binding cassette domain-containing protein [Clostridiales bacterium]
MVLNIESLNKYYNGEVLFKDINATIEDNDRIGLIGRNGCGKSTLLKIIMGMEEFDKTIEGKGAVNISNNVTVGFLQQNSGLDNYNTIGCEIKKPFDELYEILEQMKDLEQRISFAKDDVLADLTDEYAKLASYYEAKDGYIIDVKINTILNGMGFADKGRDRVIHSLSGGEKTRLAMAKLLLEEPNLLILDEPTNHLDFQTLMWLEDYLKSYKGAILIVSHDRYFLNKLCNKIWEISSKALTAYKGDYSAFLLQKDMNVQRHIKEYEAQKKEIAKLEEYVAKNKVRASTSNMAKSRQNQLDRMDIIERPETYEKPPKIRLEYEIVPPKEILNVSDCPVVVGEGTSKKTLVESFELNVRRGDKVAIVGPNGIGKTSILRLIQGIIPHERGRINWTNNLKIAYFEQENTSLDTRNTVMEEVHRRFPRMTDLDVRRVLGSVLLTGENVFKPVGVISGGEKAKLCFAIMMLQRGNVLILDEPTNHLDLATKEVLENALAEYDGTIILVSHDRYLLNKIATRVVDVEIDGVSNYKGNFDDYLEQKKANRDMQLQSTNTNNVKEVKKESENIQKQYRTKEQRALDAKKKQVIRELEKEIEELENQISEIEKEIALPENTSNYEFISTKCNELEECKNLLEEKMLKWAELE